MLEKFRKTLRESLLSIKQQNEIVDYVAALEYLLHTASHLDIEEARRFVRSHRLICPSRKDETIQIRVGRRVVDLTYETRRHCESVLRGLKHYKQVFG